MARADRRLIGLFLSGSLERTAFILHVHHIFTTRWKSWGCLIRMLKN